MLTVISWLTFSYFAVGLVLAMRTVIGPVFMCVLENVQDYDEWEINLAVKLFVFIAWLYLIFPHPGSLKCYFCNDSSELLDFYLFLEVNP